MKNNTLIKRCIGLTILLMFIGASVLPSVLSIEKPVVQMMNTMDTIIVDDEGDGDYTSIQEAIDNANPGDIIEVYSGTYSGKVTIPKQVILQGIEEEYEGGSDIGKPIIDGPGSGIVVSVQFDEVTISGFLIRNSGTGPADAGIAAWHYHTITIMNNIFEETKNAMYIWDSDNSSIIENQIIGGGRYGIWLRESSGSLISYNNITAVEGSGIYLKTCSYTEILGNTISDNEESGIYLEASNYNLIADKNYIINNKNGLYLKSSNNNNISFNQIDLNINRGIYCYTSSNDNIIYQNNFNNKDTGENALDISINTYDYNYWDDYTGSDTNGDGIGDSAYMIPNGNNWDNHPLMWQNDEESPLVDISKPIERGLYVADNLILPFLTTIAVGKITLTIDAFDNTSGLDRIELFIGETRVNISTSSPLNWTWSGGPHFKIVISAVAYDKAGNSARTERVVWKFL